VKVDPDGYVHLNKAWKAGDAIELDMPMPIRRVLADEKVEDDRGKVTLMRGPIVYCLEAADQPEVDLARLVLPRDAKMSAKHRADLLGGVTVLEGEALAEGKDPVKVTAIPYYAWQNRIKGAMTVWIKESVNP
jgi:DUF1680 family protein